MKRFFYLLKGDEYKSKDAALDDLERIVNEIEKKKGLEVKVTPLLSNHISTDSHDMYIGNGIDISTRTSFNYFIEYKSESKLKIEKADEQQQNLDF